MSEFKIFRDNIVGEKSKTFALRIIKLYKELKNNRNEYVLSKQLLRSGTSIGANLAEAVCGSSKKDFLNKVYIALKECSESLYWLELLHDSDYITDKEFNSLIKDCREIYKLLSSTTKTLKNKV